MIFNKNTPGGALWITLPIIIFEDSVSPFEYRQAHESSMIV